jgi:hypothetical protein
MESGVKYLAIIAAIITLIIVRLFCENATIISSMSFLSLIVAILLIYAEVSRTSKKKAGFNYVSGIFIIIFVIMVVILVLIFAEAIVLDDLWNDLTLLVTLLISLPEKFYIRILERWINRYTGL